MSASCERGTPGCLGPGAQHDCDEEDFAVSFVPKSSVKVNYIAEEQWIKLREFVKALVDDDVNSPTDVARIFRYIKRLENE